MNAEQLTDHILEFLRSLHETGWDDCLDALLTGIAEVEGADKGYADGRVSKLAEELIGVVQFERKANKAKEN